jgi:putative ABC transport system permease protein
MMGATSGNRSMFRRLLRRLLFANRGRLFVILLALSAGAAVSAALLNLQVDAKRRLTTEFRTFGPNILLLPKSSAASAGGRMTGPQLSQLPRDVNISIHAASLLYTIADVAPESSKNFLPVVVVGHAGVLPGSAPLDLLSKEATQTPVSSQDAEPESCLAGQQVAARLNVNAGDRLLFRNGELTSSCVLTAVLKTGGTEDSQILLPLLEVQELANAIGKISVIQINASGTPAQIEEYAQTLQHKFPDVDVHRLRQFSEAQAKIYSRISGLLTAATAIILILTALCVMAAMTNIAAERRNDVGMMKAIGGSARRVLHLFVTEAVVLGLAGGLIGAAAGIALSVVLGKAVFGVAAAPRLIVYPICVALTVIVAILGAYPLRRLVNVRPATIFRGEA